MSRKILCDRCGKDITGLQQIGFVGMSFRDPESGELLQENPLQDMDFCPECMDAIRAFVSEMPKPEPKPEPVVTLEEVAELAAKLEPDEKKNSRSLKRIRSRRAQRMSTPGSFWRCAGPGGQCRRSQTR